MNNITNSPVIQRNQVPLTKEDGERFLEKLKVSFELGYDQNIAPLVNKLKKLDIREKTLLNKIEILDKEMQVISNKEQVIANKEQVITKEWQDLLTKKFYVIFTKEPLPIEKIDLIFNTYLSDKSLSDESNQDGRKYSRINSMKAVINYLNDNPNIMLCDFRHFKAEVHDVPTLAEYLSKSNIKAIAINNGISIQAKESLNQAVNLRKGGLKVQYFA